MFCQALTSRDMPFTQLGDVPGALVMPLLVLLECVHLYWLSGVSQLAARDWGRDLGEAEADVEGCPKAEGTPASLLPPACC